MIGSKRSSNRKPPKSKSTPSKSALPWVKPSQSLRLGWKGTKSASNRSKSRSQSKRAPATGAATATAVETESFDVRWRPQAGPQFEAITAKFITELFFGGARGGGKSDFLLGDFLQDVYEYGPAWRGIIFRKTFPQLEDLILRSKEIYPKAYPGAIFREQSKTWHFPNDAFLRMRALERDAQADNFLGHQYTWMGWDELGTWASSTPYLKLIGCLRSAVPVPCKRIRSTGNPGGVGHKWVKDRFVGLHNRYAWKPRRDEGDGTTRIFIPSKLQDNKILMAADPGYVARLGAVAGVSAALLQAWLDGNWDVVAGAYFDSFGPHCIIEHREFTRRFQPHWPVWIGGDWGFKHSTAVYWFTTGDDARSYCFSELITSGKGAEELAEMIAGQNQNLAIELGLAGYRPNGLKIDDFWFSPDAFAQRTDAETVGDQLGKALEAYGLPYCAKAATDRIGGAQLLYNLWKHKSGIEPAPGEPDDRAPDPLLLISDGCQEVINVMPAMIHDPDKQEEVLKMDGDDPYDGLRYGVYSRLGPRQLPVQQLRDARLTSPDPTIRHIQALLAQRDLKEGQKLEPIPYGRRY